jgi:hypothetical protein
MSDGIDHIYKIMTAYRENIEYIKTPELSHSGYSWFNIEELYKYTTHDYTICINDDGFIINPELWDDNFLNYDLIGAPWHPDSEWLYDLGRPGNRVGNGGFYLRSRKFINLASNIRYTGGHDDAILSNDYYDYFIQNGCKYAPVEVAMKFSLEYVIPECEHNLDKTFGFHGKHDLTHEKLKLLKNIEYTIE